VLQSPCERAISACDVEIAPLYGRTCALSKERGGSSNLEGATFVILTAALPPPKGTAPSHCTADPPAPPARQPRLRQPRAKPRRAGDRALQGRAASAEDRSHQLVAPPRDPSQHPRTRVPARQQVLERVRQRRAENRVAHHLPRVNPERTLNDYFSAR